MFKQINKSNQKFRVARRVLRCFKLVLFLTALSGVFLYTRVGVPTHVQAATSDTLNFQARLLNSSGSIVDDGTYNVEFKIYDSLAAGASAQGVCVGGGTDDCAWMETRIGANKVSIKNGYMSVNLGSVTAFGSTINWDQNLYITMNIGGTGSPSYDGEMSPRLKLTAVPYALAAGQLALQTGANTSTLKFATQTAANAILLPDEAGTLCIQSSSNCGFNTDTSITLQDTYNATSGNSITTTDSRDIDILLANTATDSNFDIRVADDSTSYVAISRADGAGTSDPAQLLLIDNLDVDRVLPIGLKVQASAGGITTAIDVSDAEIVTAIAVGANDIQGTTGNIDFTNFDVVGASGNTTIGGTLAVTGTQTYTGLGTFNGGLTLATGYTFTNASSTLNTAISISDVAGGGNIGTSATTVDVATTFNVNQTTSSQTLTLPSPTTTTAGRLAYISNVGSVSFSMYGKTVATGTTEVFVWNGTAWTGSNAAGSSGVTAVGTIDSQTKSADGAVISGSSIYLQTADASNVGLVSTGTQTLAGAKTFSSLITGSAGATIQGATTNINGSSNFATNINTGTSTGAVSIGNSSAGAITLQSASTIGLTGTTTVTGLTTGVALTVNNSTSTGNVLSAQDNGTNVFVVADGGNIGIKTGATAPSYDLSFGVGGARTIAVQTQTTAATAGDALTVRAAIGNTTGTGGSLSLQGGAGGTSGAGGAVLISGGASGGGATSGGSVAINGGAASATAGSTGGGVTITGANGSSTTTGGTGGAITITAGSAGGTGDNDGSDVTLSGGLATGNGLQGSVIIKPVSGADSDVALLIQDASGDNILTVDSAQHILQPGSTGNIESQSPTSTDLAATNISNASYHGLTVLKDGLPAFLSRSSNDLLYRKCLNSACTSVSSQVVFGESNANLQNWSLADSSTGNPMIWYKNGSSLKYVVCGNSTCTSGNSSPYTAMSTSTPGTSPSAIRAPDGNVWAFHKATGPNDLYVSQCDNAACSSVTNVALETTGNVGNAPQPALSYCSEADRVASQNPNACVIVASITPGTDDDVMVSLCNVGCSAVTSQVIDEAYAMASTNTNNIQIAILPNGLPVIARLANPNMIEVIKCNNLSCSSYTSKILVASGVATTGFGMTNGEFGLPVIAYNDSTSAYLTIIQCGVDTCDPALGQNTTTIYNGAGGLPTVANGTSANMVVGGDGYPFIVSKQNDGVIQLTHCVDFTCSLGTVYGSGAGVSLGTSTNPFNRLYVNMINDGMEGASFSVNSNGLVTANSLSSDDAGNVLVRSTTTTALTVKNADTGDSVFNVDAANAIVSLNSAGSATLKITADTDNVDESHQPQLIFSQDGGFITALIGYQSSQNDLSIQTNTAIAGVGDLFLGTNATTRLGLSYAGRATYTAVNTTGTDFAINNATASQTTNNLLSIIQSGTTTGFTGNVVNITSSSTTGSGNALNVTAVNTTAGNGINLTTNALTTGDGLNVNSTSTGLTTGSLVRVSSGTTAAVATDGIVSFQATGNYTSTSNIGLLSVLANSTTAGTVQNVQGNALTTGNALRISSTGTGLTTGSLLYVTSATTGAVATNGIVSLNATGNYTSTSNAGLLNVTANSTTAGTIVNIQGTGLTSGTALNINAGAGNGLVLGGSGSDITTASNEDLVIVSNGSGAVSLDSGAGGSVSIATGSTAKSIAIGGTGANTITIGNTQTGGSISLGAALTSGTINIGGTGLQTGTINLGVGTGAQAINLGTGGTGAKTVTVGSVASSSSVVIQTGTGSLNLETQGTGGVNIAANAVAQPVVIGNGTGGTSVTINTGTGGINIGTNAVAQTTTIGNTTGATGVVINTGSGLLNFGTTQAQFTEVTGTRTLTVQTRTTDVAGTNLTVSAGAGGSGAANTGGTLSLQGGAAGATGNANGGDVILSGGASVGTGVLGAVTLAPTRFIAATVQNFTGSASITQANIDSYSTILISSNASGYTATLSDPTVTIAGRVIYVTNTGSYDMTLSVNGGGSGNTVTLKPNTTATMIWNGTDWTAAGASSSTDLQAAYDNTATSAGGAELVLNASGGAADGLTVRNNGTTPIIGGLLEVQTSIGSNLFSVNNNATEYADNGGAETSTFTMWTATPDGGTIARYTTVGDYVATGQASVSVTTSATADHGVRNTLASALTPNLKYNVSFAVRGTTNFSTLDIVYSKDGTNTATTSCSTAVTVTTGRWSRITCYFTAPSSGITSSNAIFIRQSDATARVYYVDNLSVNVGADVNHASDGSVDSALGTNWTAFGSLDNLTRDTAVIYDTSGSVNVDAPNNADRGVRNNLTITPSVSTQYLVTFYARSSNAFSDIRVRYSRDGGTSFVSCVDYNTQTLSTSTWTKITCLFTTDSTTATDADLIIDQPTASDRNFYVDALSITLNTNTASNVQVGGGSKGGPATLLTLDRSSTAPIADNNDAYLGSMYYDTTTGRIQCYEADGWGACGSAPDNIVNLNPEFAGAVLNGTGVGTMTADFCGNGGGLSVNTGLCASGEARNYYEWTSPQATQQTYSVYVTYQLPATFKGFASDDTVQLTARTDNTTNAAVTFEMFKSQSGSITQCGTGETTVVTTANTWQTVGINGNESTGCSFSTSSASAFVIFKINVKANSNANAYVGTLSFTTTGN